MRVYFVRHGQSIFNADPFRNKTHQSLTTPLGEAGLAQAKKVAQRFHSIPIDIIYSSNATRALKTAEAINEVIQKEMIITDLLRERQTPTIFHGKERDDPEIMKIKSIIQEHKDDPNWHYADEENFFDFQNRGMKFLNSLENEVSANILAVSHGYMLSLLAMLMIYGEQLTQDIYTPFMKSANSTNTGVSMFEFKDNKWRLLTWNDYAHLGE